MSTGALRNKSAEGELTQPAEGTSKHKKSPTRKKTSLQPPQHGGWAFVGLPVAVGWVVGGLTLATVFAGIAFVLSFPTLYFVGAWLRYPNRERFVRPLAIWLSITTVFGIAAIALAPSLLYWAPAYLLLGLTSLLAAKKKKDRELINEVFQIIQCSMIVPTIATATDQLAHQATILATIWVTMTLIGSILMVRAFIRKKNDSVFRRRAQIVAVASWPLAVLVGAIAGWIPALVAGIAFGYAIWRAFKVRPEALRPGQLGMIELVFFVLVWGAALSALLVSLS